MTSFSVAAKYYVLRVSQENLNLKLQGLCLAVHYVMQSFAKRRQFFWQTNSNF